MRSWKIGLAIAMLACIAALSLTAQDGASDGPRFVDGTRLARPTNYREWVFVGSSVGLTYLPPGNGTAAPPFANVFVNPSSYRSFMQTGKWPNATMLVLEVRRSSSESELVKGGRFQTDLVALEANVKDSRLPDGWAFYTWGPPSALKDAADPAPPGQAIPGEGTCVDCHINRTAVERTFVQFYPTLLEVARQKGTVKPGF